jgi:hypothetical protein
MNYMWEVILQGQDQNIARKNIRFRPSKMANPYREVFFEDFNNAVLTDETVDVNAHYRYGAVFGELLSEDVDEYPELQAVLFDILAHYLTKLDLRSGLCRDEYYALFLSGDKLNCFDRREKHLVTAGLVRMYKLGTSMKLFSQLLRELYPQSIVYLDARGVRELLVYVGKKQTPQLTAQLEFLCDSFVPADYDVKIFWELHFGLIGTDETLEIGEIMLY